MDGAAKPARRPRPSAAAVALFLAVVALGLSLYGSLLSELHLAGSRLNEARLGPGAEFTRSSEAVRTSVEVVGYVVPFVLGVAAAVLAARAMGRLGNLPVDRMCHLAAVFAVMIGALAAVVSGCMLLAVYGWKHVPHWYTA